MPEAMKDGHSHSCTKRVDETASVPRIMVIRIESWGPCFPCFKHGQQLIYERERYGLELEYNEPRTKAQLVAAREE